MRIAVDPFLGPQVRLQPIVEDHSYENDYTLIEDHASAAGDGVRSKTVWDQVGLIMGRTNWALASLQPGIILTSETYNYKDQSNNYLDPLRRSHDVTDLALRTTKYRYNDCCGLDYIVNPEGSTNRYAWDSLRREVAVTRFFGGSTGITTTNVLDSAGAVLETRRIATNGSTITLAQYLYNVLGEVAWHTNALGGVTYYTNVLVDGRRCTTNTAPDGGTRVELYYRDGTLELTTGTSVHGVKHVRGAEQDGTTWREFTKEFKLDGAGTETSEWTKTYFDGAGRAYKTLYSASQPPYPYSQSYFDLTTGKLIKQRDPDGVIILFSYNGQGELEYSALDLDQNDSIDIYGTDRVTKTERSYMEAAGTKPDLVRTDTIVWTTEESQTVQKTRSRSEVSADGLRTWQIVAPESAIPVISESRTVYAGGGTHYVTNSAPDGSYSLSTYSFGRLSSVKRLGPQHNLLSSTTESYDAHGRRSATEDARNGTTSYGYNNADLITSVTSPSPGTIGGLPQTIVNHYSPMLQATNVVQPDGTSVTNEFYLTGLLKRIYGARTYPVGYSYDYAGRMKTMTNWSGFSATGAGTGARVTRWNYKAQRGWLDNKRYADNQGPSYTYTAAGRLQTRSWARGVTTTYGYNNAGALTNVDYSDSTPDVTYTFDRRGRQSTIVQGGTTTTLAYNLAGEMLCETNNGGTLNGLSVTNGYDSLMRRSTVTALSGASTVLATAGYGFDGASRLNLVTSGTAAVGYSYLANSPQVQHINFTNSGALRMTTTKAHDFLNRLQSIASVNAQGSSFSSFAYVYNSSNQRTLRREADGSYWRYEFDALGQVKSAKKYWSDGTPVAGQQFEYGFDDIGNRRQTKAGGDEGGLNLRTNTYGASLLNQYTNRQVQGAVDVMGLAIATNTVTVNSAATYRKGEYFRKELAVGNTSVPVWLQVDVAAPGETTVTRHDFVPKTPEVFTYDADGNLTSDGRWTNSWDAENRLIKVESLSTSPTDSKRKVIWEFDGKGRRTRQTTFDGSSGSYVVTEDLKFLSDGWRHIAELNATNNAVIRSYVWGLDLTGTMDGAGGVGGLLMMNSAANGIHFHAYDGNGNVAALVKASDGTVSANYEYGPFGEPLRVTGSVGSENPFRFSTKRANDTVGLVLFEFRPYSPDFGRWLGRDPIGHTGGANLYAYVFNLTTSCIDPLGLDTHSGGTEVWPKAKDVSFNNSHIGTVQVWKNAAYKVWAFGVWIQFDKDKAAANLTCKWVQFVMNRIFDQAGKERGKDHPILMPINYNQFYRKAGDRYLDVGKPDDTNPAPAWQYQPSISSGNMEAIYDEPWVTPILTATNFKMVLEFESILLCRPEKCDPQTKWKSAFQVSWKFTEEYQKPMERRFDVTDGRSIGEMPPWAREPRWTYGLDITDRKPLTVENPTQ